MSEGARRLASAAASLRRRSSLALDRYFAGEVRAWIYVVLRVGLASLLLIRHADWLRPWLSLDHHRWVHGLEFSWSTPREPHLCSPLIRGLALGPRATYWLVRVRTGLAFTLLFGVRSRSSALLLSIVCYALLFADRYRYFHHLHVLYLAVLWLSLVPEAPRFELSAWRPAWPLQLLRAGVLSIYFAAGSAKLNSVWLSGATLAELTRLHALNGPTWTVLQRVIGLSLAAKLVCGAELALTISLAARRTRRASVLLGGAFHALLSTCVAVSTFGVEMALLLLSFWPEWRKEAQ